MFRIAVRHVLQGATALVWLLSISPAAAGAQYVATATVHADPGNHRVRATLEPIMAHLERGTSLGGGGTIHLGLAPKAWIHAHGYGAYPLEGDFERHYVADLAFALVHNGLALSNESYTLDSGSVPVYGGTVYFRESVTQPTVQRRLLGGRVGGRFDQGLAELDPAGTPPGDAITMGARRVDVYAGVTITRSVDTTIAVSGYGLRTNQRWVTFGLDALYAVALFPDVDTSDDGGRFGGRILGAWALGIPYGFGGSFEAGYAPGGAGWYGTAGLGMSWTAGQFAR